jgi:primary-amine oxidase
MVVEQSTMPNTQLDHPLRFLTDGEIRSASSVLLRQIQEDGASTAKIHFKNISLHEPKKQFLFPYLEAEAKGVPPEQRPYVPRCVDIIWSSDNGRNVAESTVSLDSMTVVGQSHTRKGQHGPNDR